VHVDKRCVVAQVDDDGGTSTNTRYQLPREAPIVLCVVYTLSLGPVKAGTSAVGVARLCAIFQIKTGSDRMRLKN
jgi:hypothetical protein